MKQLTLTITDSFKLRNLIKSKIREVDSQLFSIEPTYEKELGSVKVDTINKKFGNAYYCVEFLLSLHKTLGELNCAIDIANVQVRPLLDKVEILRSNILTLERLFSQIRNKSQKVKINFNSVTGNNDTVEMVQVYTEEQIEQLEETARQNRRERLELEQEISRLNGEVKFDYQIEEGIYDFLYDL